ncbi:NAD(P)H-hydrate dehydratase [Pelagibius sp.]|uniref:NAD(P)H-hydrate dehydratase n=1 Tax=Pelagibius sp. TaxID=1931238 RepID=UPI002AC31500|nr:NAD(P)H-hydrate dehydratase [Pelagibius sp.]
MMLPGQDAAANDGPWDADLWEPAEVLTVQEMYEADRLAIAEIGSGYPLMERAGAGVAARVLARRNEAGDGPVAVLCGPGNNGGDGFVAARHLRAAGVPVRLALLGAKDRLSGDAGTAAAAWEGAVQPLEETCLDDAAQVVDALFGAGLDRPLSGVPAQLAAVARDASLPVFAVDVPSGIAGDTATPLGGLAFQALETITFFRKKPAHLLVPSRFFCGDVHVIDIGIPATVLDGIAPRCRANGPALWARAFPWRKAEAHKYQAGHAVICGGARMTGAAQLASRAALRVGAGLVTVVCSPDSLPIYALANPSVITQPLTDPADFADILADPRKNAVLLGPGNGVSQDTADRALLALESAPAGRAVVLDADALSSFEGRAERLFAAVGGSAGAAVLTPHDGEFHRLFPDLAGNRLERASAAAARSGAVVVLKGPDSVVAAPEGPAVINGAAPPWLATAGTGDVLAGLITGLLAQGMAPVMAASAAVWLHAAAASTFGPGMIAEDLPDALPDVMGELYSASPAVDRWDLSNNLR